MEQFDVDEVAKKMEVTARKCMAVATDPLDMVHRAAEDTGVMIVALFEKVRELGGDEGWVCALDRKLGARLTIIHVGVDEARNRLLKAQAKVTEMN